MGDFFCLSIARRLPSVLQKRVKTITFAVPIESIMIMELSKNYIPSDTEEKWYAHWLKKGYFSSRPDDRPAFTVVIPPPNVTGVLHMGHTLNETVQDILVRKARMNGYNACWVPGSDHASIATEAKVVGMLKERGIDKNELSRPAFMEYAYEWKDKYGGIIYSQIRKLGCSVDWDRVSFTMDPDYYSAVIRVFVDLYGKGLIYRGARMIHWDPVAKTALSDEEVEYKEEQGKLYYVDYPLVDSESRSLGRSITIATQRPETIMGDTAICVNPNDERYQDLAGAFALVPLVNRRVPVIFDEYVDPAFGTGALKVTPAHDINDYNLGLKHSLPIIDTLNPDGTLSAAAEVFVGMDRFAARKKVVGQLQAEGLLLKEEEHTTRLGFSQRTNAVVEPRISTQWFVRMKEMAGPALTAVTEGHITIHPGDKFLATYKYWLENVKDWCISRQLWWGQQIPAWYAPDGSFRVAATREEAYALFGAATTGGNPSGGRSGPADPEGGAVGNDKLPFGKNDKLPFGIDELYQDEDVLDTWFSSWLWPIEVFKGVTHPGNADIQYYYPTAVLVTGQDIIFFWVARMIMAGLYYFPDSLPIDRRIPFKDVYFTGMVRDKQGRKMSKSLGNSPDLLMLIEKYGADAVRFGIMISSPAGNDLLFDEAALEQGRNFNNKLWNALKLVRGWEGRQQAAPSAGSASATPGDIDLPFAVTWFDNRLQEARATLEQSFGEFRLSEALKTLYSLIWDDFCSWYLEWVKPGFEQPIDAGVYRRTVGFFEQLMQLLHPFMPFITEEVYHLLAEHSDDLCVRQFAAQGKTDASILEQGNLLKEAITALRDARSKAQLKPKESIRLYIQSEAENTYRLISPILARQVNAERIEFTTDSVPGALTVVSGKDKYFIVTEKVVDTGGQKEEMLKELGYLKGFLDSVNKKLGNERFVQNAKPEIVDVERKKKTDAEDKIKVLEESLAGLV
jgi:valyl-tRNA synthetase